MIKKNREKNNIFSSLQLSSVKFLLACVTMRARELVQSLELHYPTVMLLYLGNPAKTQAERVNIMSLRSLIASRILAV